MSFFAQSLHKNLALPQAAWLGIFFVGKLVQLHLLETKINDTLKKSPASGGIQTLSVKRSGLYRFATTDDKLILDLKGTS